MTNFFKGKFGILTWAIALALFTTATPGSAQTLGMVIDGSPDVGFQGVVSGVHIFNADTRQVLKSIPTPALAGDCSISADGSTGYFTRIDNMLQIVDLTNLQLGSLIALPTNPAQDTALSADGRFLVICDGAGTAQKISVVDTATDPPTIASTFQPTDLSGVTSCTAVAVCDNNDVLITTKGIFPDVQRLQLDGFGVLTEYGPADRYTGLLGSDVPQDVLCGPGGATAVVVLNNFLAPEVLSFTTNPLTLADSRALKDRGIAGEPDVPPGPALFGGAAAINPAGDRVYVRSWLNIFVVPSSCSSPLSGVPTDEICGLIEVHAFNAATGLFGDPAPDEDVIGPIRVETQGFGIDSMAVHPGGTRLFVSEHAGYDALTFAATGTLAAVNVYNADGSVEGPLSDMPDGVTPSTAIKAPTGICFGPIGDSSGPVSFEEFTGTVQIALLPEADDDQVFLNTNFKLGDDSNGIDPEFEDVSITVTDLVFGTPSVSVTIPAGNFVKKTTRRKEFFKVDGVFDGYTVELKIDILVPGSEYTFKGSISGANLDGVGNEVTVDLEIGADPNADGGSFNAFVLFI